MTQVPFLCSLVNLPLLNRGPSPTHPFPFPGRRGVQPKPLGMGGGLEKCEEKEKEEKRHEK
jgi:hypothetical protein